MLCSSGIFSELEICYMAQFQSSQKSRPCDSSLGSFSSCRIGNSGIRFNHDSCLDLIFFHWNLFASGDEAFYIYASMASFAISKASSTVSPKVKPNNQMQEKLR